MFHCSTIRCSTVPPSDVLLSNHQIFYCSTIFVPPFHHQMFHCTIMIVPLFHRQMFCCSTIRCSTVPTTDVLLFHHQMSHCSTICSTIRCSPFNHLFPVPPSEVPLFLHFCSTFPRPAVPPSLFHCSTIKCSTVPPSDVLLSSHQIFYCSNMK